MCHCLVFNVFLVQQEQVSEIAAAIGTESGIKIDRTINVGKSVWGLDLLGACF